MGPKCQGDFDGFSGAPVFGISVEVRVIELRGIVLRGGNDKPFFASIDWVHKLCDIALERPKIEPIAA